MQGMILDPGLQPGDERHQLVSSPKSFHFPNRSNSLQGGQQPSGPYNCLGLAKSFFFFWPRHEHPQLPLSDNQTPSPWSESTGLNHWTTRAVPLLSLLVAGERRNSCFAEGRRQRPSCPRATSSSLSTTGAELRTYCSLQKPQLPEPIPPLDLPLLLKKKKIVVKHKTDHPKHV